jgi:hypothetical protein
MGTKLLMSTAFHPQMDGQTERANCNIGQILQTVISHNQKNWVDKIPMTEFAINISISETMKAIPFELNYGYLPQMIQEIKNTGSMPGGVKAFTENALIQLAAAHDAIIAARTQQTMTANRKRQQEPSWKEGDLVYLSTKNLNLPKNRAQKLCPKYIGPYRIAEAHLGTSNYMLELPLALKLRQIHA